MPVFKMAIPKSECPKFFMSKIDEDSSYYQSVFTKNFKRNKSGQN